MMDFHFGVNVSENGFGRFVLVEVCRNFLGIKAQLSLVATGVY